jgi:dynein heavy chain
MIYEDWREDIRTRNIPMSATFKIEELLTNDVEIAKWASE